MAARAKVRRLRRRQSGQSLLEFAFLVPLLIGFFTLLVEVQGAISGAIVGQRYVRQHLHYVFFNSRYYPEMKFLLNTRDNYINQREWFGLDKNVNDTVAPPRPVAPSYKIGRKKVPTDDVLDDNITQRQNLRLFISAFVCIPPLGPNAREYYSEDKLEETTFVGGSFRGFCLEEK